MQATTVPAAQEATAVSLKERAYKIIKDKIVSCQYPPGRLLSEKDLVEEVGASRTPIREALSRLEQEQLVVIVPQRGSFVAPITAKTINDIYQVRELLEPQLIRLVMPVLPEAALRSFHVRFAALENDAFTEAIRVDSDFHSFILRSCNNEYLIQIMETMYAQNERIRITMVRVPKRLRETTVEHLAIIEGLLAGDSELASQAMRTHMINAKHSAIRFHLGHY